MHGKSTLVCSLSCALALHASSGSGLHAQTPLLTPLAAHQRSLQDWDAEQRLSDSMIAATEFVRFDSSSLRALRDGESATLALDLFGDRRSVRFSYFQHQLQHAVYLGRVPGTEGSVVLAVHPDGTGAGIIDLDGQRWVLNYTGVERAHAIHRLDPTRAHAHDVCG